jgi:uridine kinase
VIAKPPLADLADLVGALRRLDPSCGPSRLVGVDGHAGSGKSTFAACLSVALGNAPVLPLDSLATHDEPFEWTGRMRQQVIDPLRCGEPARYLPYDWHTRGFGPPLTLPPAPVVLVEGVGSGRAALRPWLACLLWMDLPREEAWRRGRWRDGPGLKEFWNDWTEAERRHFAADPSRPFAHHFIRQSRHTKIGKIDEAVHQPGRMTLPASTGPGGPMAYAVLPGPAGSTGPDADTAGTTRDIT